MDTLINIFGFLALGALLIAAFVFGNSVKRYVSGDDLGSDLDTLDSDFSPYPRWRERSLRDRRTAGETVSFPFVVNGEVITEDRRRSGDRRCA